VLQVMFDVLDRRDAVLVSYQGDATTSDPALHAWNGQEWVFVSPEDYEAANFVQIAPKQAVLIGDESTLPPSLVARSSWCPLVMSIPEVDSASLVNSLGKVFKFSPSEWSWFARRYNLTLTDLNEDRRKTSWYDRPYVETRYPYSPAAVEVDEVEVVYPDSAPAEISTPPGTDAAAPEAGASESAIELPPASVVIEAPAGETDDVIK
jgi:hypothetical protein